MAKQKEDDELKQVRNLTEVEIGDEIAKYRYGIYRKVPGLGTLAMAFQVGIGDEHFTRMGGLPKTMYTDGRGIYVYPPFFNSMQMPEDTFVFLHELSHNILGHTGEAHRNQKIKHPEIPAAYWQTVEEYQCNAFVKNVLMPALEGSSLHVQMPAMAVFEKTGKVDQTWSTLEIAQWLIKENPPEEYEIQITVNGQPLPGQGNGEGAGNGGKKILKIDLLDAPPENADAKEAEAKKNGQGNGNGQAKGVAQGEIEEAARESVDAMINRIMSAAAGMGGGPLSEWIQEHYFKSEIPWRTVLDRFIMKNKPGDKFNPRPHRRAMATYDQYHPTRKGSFVRGVIFVDSSGSVGDGALEKVFSHISAFLNQMPQHEVYLIAHDWDAAEPVKIGPGHKLPKVHLPRGGTSFSRPLAFLRKQEFFSRMDWIIWFTDGYPCEEWPSKKDFGNKPTMWIISHGGALPPKELGQVLFVEKIEAD